MKKHRLKSKALDELASIPNISVVCAKLGISRQAMYKWQNEDSGFREACDSAIDRGRQSITDLAISKLIERIGKGDMRAILAWLESNDPTYYKPRTAQPREATVPITQFNISLIGPEDGKFSKQTYSGSTEDASQ